MWAYRYNFGQGNQFRLCILLAPFTSSRASGLDRLHDLDIIYDAKTGNKYLRFLTM